MALSWMSLMAFSRSGVMYRSSVSGGMCSRINVVAGVASICICGMIAVATVCTCTRPEFGPGGPPVRLAVRP
jgi:hypothetical protein